jgi:uncharacterized membrane protein YhhN
MKLIPNWQRAHRMLSNQLVVVDGALLIGWTQIPPELKSAVPAYVLAIAAGAWLALKVGVRLIDQGSVTAAPEEPKA